MKGEMRNGAWKGRYVPGCWVVPPHDTPDARSSQGYNHREALKEVTEWCLDNTKTGWAAT